VTYFGKMFKLAAEPTEKSADSLEREKNAKKNACTENIHIRELVNPVSACKFIVILFK
jgi:hypothetical protein